MEIWEQLKPLLVTRLASVPKTKSTLAVFFESWLGPSDPTALKECEELVLSPTPDQPIRGDVFAYRLKDEEGFKYFLIVDFRIPDRPGLNVATEYAPAHKKDAHDQISQAEFPEIGHWIVGHHRTNRRSDIDVKGGDPQCRRIRISPARRLGAVRSRAGSEEEAGEKKDLRQH